ncbi:hypothetical protein KIPB_003723 [Kipferlia bialata]|uniref:Uncharacterized protein n=1 Tax=Kipferlia bialata TaxID=797122 RepID=A0A9K3CTC3_9EUKA|nr:hypothetical protein KIPB_003723 [Kipferlia bialata]|eukprot:g3723.t1
MSVSKDFADHYDPEVHALCVCLRRSLHGYLSTQDGYHPTQHWSQVKWEGVPTVRSTLRLLRQLVPTPQSSCVDTPVAADPVPVMLLWVSTVTKIMSRKRYSAVSGQVCTELARCMRHFLPSTEAHGDTSMAPRVRVPLPLMMGAISLFGMVATEAAAPSVALSLSVSVTSPSAGNERERETAGPEEDAIGVSNLFLTMLRVTQVIDAHEDKATVLIALTNFLTGASRSLCIDVAETLSLSHEWTATAVRELQEDREREGGSDSKDILRRKEGERQRIHLIVSLLYLQMQSLRHVTADMVQEHSLHTKVMAVLDLFNPTVLLEWEGVQTDRSARPNTYFSGNDLFYQRQTETGATKNKMSRSRIPPRDPEPVGVYAALSLGSAYHDTVLKKPSFQPCGALFDAVFAMLREQRVPALLGVTPLPTLLPHRRGMFFDKEGQGEGESGVKEERVGGLEKHPVTPRDANSGSSLVLTTIFTCVTTLAGVLLGEAGRVQGATQSLGTHTLCESIEKTLALIIQVTGDSGVVNTSACVSLVRESKWSDLQTEREGEGELERASNADAARARRLSRVKVLAGPLSSDTQSVTAFMGILGEAASEPSVPALISSINLMLQYLIPVVVRGDTVSPDVLARVGATLTQTHVVMTRLVQMEHSLKEAADRVRQKCRAEGTALSLSSQTREDTTAQLLESYVKLLHTVLALSPSPLSLPDPVIKGTLFEIEGWLDDRSSQTRNLLGWCVRALYRSECGGVFNVDTLLYVVQDLKCPVSLKHQFATELRNHIYNAVRSVHATPNGDTSEVVARVTCALTLITLVQAFYQAPLAATPKTLYYKRDTSSPTDLLHCCIRAITDNGKALHMASVLERIGMGPAIKEIFSRVVDLVRDPLLLKTMQKDFMQ